MIINYLTTDKNKMDVINKSNFEEIFNRLLRSTAENQNWVHTYYIEKYISHTNIIRENFFTHNSGKNLENEISKFILHVVDDVWFPHGRLEANFRNEVIETFKESFSSAIEEISNDNQFIEKFTSKICQEIKEELDGKFEDEDIKTYIEKLEIQISSLPTECIHNLRKNGTFYFQRCMVFDKTLPDVETFRNLYNKAYDDIFI